MNIVLVGAVMVAILAWGHFALERNVNRMAQQLQDQINASNRNMAAMREQIDELRDTCRKLEWRVEA